MLPLAPVWLGLKMGLPAAKGCRGCREQLAILRNFLRPSGRNHRGVVTRIGQRDHASDDISAHLAVIFQPSLHFTDGNHEFASNLNGGRGLPSSVFAGHRGQSGIRHRNLSSTSRNSFNNPVQSNSGGGRR
jgi:hypothetical protein